MKPRLVAQFLETKLVLHSPISDLLISAVGGAASASAAAPNDDFENFLPGDSSTDAPPSEDRLKMPGK
jgi:hypothetical protein